MRACVHTYIQACMRTIEREVGRGGGKRKGGREGGREEGRMEGGREGGREKGKKGERDRGTEREGLGEEVASAQGGGGRGDRLVLKKTSSSGWRSMPP